MIKRLILTGLLVLLTGCSNGYTYEGNTTTPAASVETKSPTTTKPSSPTTKLIDTEKRPPETTTWISPGKVLIGNFYRGAEAEYPITIHNGGTTGTDTKKVTTDPGETEADISLNSLLSRNSLKSIDRLSSDNSKDTLVPVSYNPDTGLKIRGFSPADTRVLVMQYQADTKFTIEVKPPDWADQAYVDEIKEVVDWIIIVDPTPVLAPLETREIMVQIKMPFNSKITMKQLEFWTVVVSDQKGQVQVALATRWIITMRG